jgi:hypothetical protein
MIHRAYVFAPTRSLWKGQKLADLIFASSCERCYHRPPINRDPAPSIHSQDVLLLPPKPRFQRSSHTPLRLLDASPRRPPRPLARFLHPRQLHPAAPPRVRYRREAARGNIFLSRLDWLRQVRTGANEGCGAVYGADGDAVLV